MACQLVAHMRQSKDMCHMTREDYQTAAVRIHGQPLWVPQPGVRGQTPFCSIGGSGRWAKAGQPCHIIAACRKGLFHLSLCRHTVFSFEWLPWAHRDNAIRAHVATALPARRGCTS